MYTIQELSKFFAYQIASIQQPGHRIEHLLIDSRKLLYPRTSLFFAFLGKQTDGHLFISSMYEEGVRSFVIEDPDFDYSSFPDANFFVVKSALESIQSIGKTHRTQFDLPVIALTGSNGKTIIKEWINQLLENDKNIVRSPGSYNSQIGVPLSVWRIDKEADLALIEVGISKKGEMSPLQKIVSPTIGIFTNLGDAHSVGFSSKEEKLADKLLLFKSAEKIICERDEEFVWSAIKKTYPDRDIIDWSMTDPRATLFISAVEKENKTSHIHYRWASQNHSFSIPFKDPVSIRMAIFAVLTALVTGTDPMSIGEKTTHLSTVPMRLEVKDGSNNCLLINDSYNADLSSFTQALHFLTLQDRIRKRVLILSDFYQIEQTTEKLNRKLAELIEKHHFSRLVLVGHQVHSVKDYLSESMEIHHFRDTETLLEKLDDLQFKDEVILMKGARRFAFEKIFTKLTHRYHSTTLEINLDSMAQNLLLYELKMNPGTKKMVIIKASGYGAGSVKIAGHLEKYGVDYFGVAFMDEGIELRQGGIVKPIMVFNSDLAYLDEMIRYKLEPVIHSFAFLERLLADCPPGLGVHLKLDTGLNRLGFQQEEMDRLCRILSHQRQFKVLSVYTHLSATPTRKYDDFTHLQAKRYMEMYPKIAEALRYRPLRHILNSAGVINFPEYQFDMVRVGSGLHGVDTSYRIHTSLHVVHTLKARINLIKKVKAGDSIGYERMGIEDHPRRIAIIPIGYADGLVRKAGNKNYHVWINGAKAPIVGHVNMDMSFIDITGLPNVELGDEVEVFGPNIPIQNLAKAGDTIFYEILTRISPRVKRVYIET
jgi:alanine racemase